MGKRIRERKLSSGFTYASVRAILGFVSRHEAEECLHKSENGTFLIRFSDSELGGVTVAWITGNSRNSSTNNKRVIWI